MRVSPQRLFFPLLVSFSVTGAGVILVYFLNKKKNEEEKKVTRKRIEQSSTEIQIPRQFVPLVIGRAGSVIQSIQESTNTKINFKEESDVDLLERTCVIIGSLENIKLAEEKIKSILNNQPIIETYETWVPHRSISRITERGEEILNQIQNSSNAKIILDSSLTHSDSDAKKRVIIKGTAEQIANALLQIEDKVREDNESKAKAETSVFNRVPRIKTSPIAAPEINVKNVESPTNFKDVDRSKEIFGSQGNEGFIEVFVCAVENPSQFYIQVISRTNAMLDDLVKDMTEYYQLEENRELHALSEITVGQMVAAKFPLDDRWYRAEILADAGKEKHSVYFVDFGDQEKIPDKDILELRTDFLSLRLQAIECSLAGVKPRDGEWSAEASETFGQMSALANWQPRMAKIRGYKERTLACGPSRREGSPIPSIELYEKRADDQLINIGKELIKLDLACAESEPSSLASSTLSLSRRSQESASKSPEVPAKANGHRHRPIEEIDLTLSPEPKLQAPGRNIETIDLASSPEKETKNDSKNALSNFLENERNSQVTSNGNGRYQSSKKTPPANPFKPRKTTHTPTYIAVPAGYESELSDDSEGFECN